MSHERTNLFDRLGADGGRYLLTIAQEEPTTDSFGAKITTRFLTEAEYRSIFSGLHHLENMVGASPPRCCGHEWYEGACIHCEITVREWRGRPPAQEPLGNESAKLVGGE